MEGDSTGYDYYEADTNAWDAVEAAAPSFFSGVFSLFGGSPTAPPAGSQTTVYQEEDKTQTYILYGAIAAVVIVIIFLIVKANKK